MKSIVIPAHVMKAVIECNIGARTILPVIVDWPELQLTADQEMANAIAHAKGKTGPYPNPAHIELVFER